MAGAEKTSKTGGLLGIAIAALVLAVAGGAGGYFVGQYMVDTIRADIEASEKTRTPDLETTYTGTRRVAIIPPVVTNLAQPRGVWIRLETAIVFDEASGGVPESLPAEIASDIQAFVSTLTTAHIEGASGLQYLKQDLNERARLRSEGQVLELLITSLVVE